jgi:hypothetical protein
LQRLANDVAFHVSRAIGGATPSAAPVRFACPITSFAA